MGDFVREMHTGSESPRCPGLGDHLEDAQAQVMAYVTQWVPEPRGAASAATPSAPIGGFLARDMPWARQHLHYRVIDVSSIRSSPAVGTCGPSPPPPSRGHRALADIRESIAELRYYRQAVFIEPPGHTQRGVAPSPGTVVDHGSAAEARS